MRKVKELNACITLLRAVQGGSDVGPEQRKDIEQAMEQVKQLRRTPHPSQQRTYCAVREITEALIRAFFKK